MQYKIIDITNKDGSQKMDLLSINRIGTTGEIVSSDINKPLIFDYDHESKRKTKYLYIITSPIRGIGGVGDILIIRTENSFYKLQKIA